jgi:hypothetical protein
LVIDSSGNVGIGTASPTSKLTTYYTGIYDSNTTRFVDIAGEFFGTNPSSATNAGAFTGIRMGNITNGKYAMMGAVSEDNLGYSRANGLSFWTSPQDTAPIERLRISSAGNVGIGTTAPANLFDVTGGAGTQGNPPSSGTAAGGVARIRSYNNTLSIGSTVANTLWLQAADATSLGTYYPISLNPNGGNIGIGTTSPEYKFEVKGGVSWFRNFSGTAASPTETHDWPIPAMNIASYGNYNLQTMLAFTLPNDGNYFLGYGAWNFKLDQTVLSTTSAGVSGMQFGGPGYLAFLPGGTEKVRIDSSGSLLVGTTSSFNAGTHCFDANAVSYTTAIRQQSATGSGIHISVNSNNGSSQFLYGLGAGTASIIIYSNGDIKNANNSYGAISDAKLKENIFDATPKLDDLMKVKIRQFNLVSDKTKNKQIGVIAQELEEVFAGMVDTSNDKDVDGNDLGTTTKSVKYSVFVPILIKSLQELNANLVAELQSLRQRVAALESK